MAKVIESTGRYTAPNGAEVTYGFQYEQLDSLQDAIATLGGEKEVLKAVQRMVKVDANNTSREKAKVENGHSSRASMTEEQKAQAKAKRQSDAQLLKALKEQGITSLSDLKNLK